jgi:hypothetical protein
MERNLDVCTVFELVTSFTVCLSVISGKVECLSGLYCGLLWVAGRKMLKGRCVCMCGKEPGCMYCI